MSESEDACSFLVSVKLPDPGDVPEKLLGMLQGNRVHLLGSYIVSDQASPEQARDEFEEEARETLSTYEEAFGRTGQVVDTRLVFTRDIGETLSRVEDELQYDAILIPADVKTVERVLVATTGEVDFARIRRCCGAILRGENLKITLMNVAESEEDEEERELTLTGLREKLSEMGGMPEENIRVESSSSGNPTAAIAEVAQDYDFIILAEKEPTIRERLFSYAWELVADEYEGPVFIIRLGD